MDIDKLTNEVIRRLLAKISQEENSPSTVAWTTLPAPVSELPGVAGTAGLAAGFGGANVGMVADCGCAGVGAGAPTAVAGVAAAGAGVAADCGCAGTSGLGVGLGANAAAVAGAAVAGAVALADCGCAGVAAGTSPKKVVITEDKAMNIAPGSKVAFPKGTIITPLAKDVFKDRQVCVELV